MIELKNTSLAKLNCKKCQAYLSCGPIRITTTGENICGRCNLTLEEQCITTRNTAYEELAAEILFPCRYRHQGCNKKFQWNAAPEHEEQCDYRVYDCPVLPAGACLWKGTNSQLLDHYKREHADLVLQHPYKLYPDLHHEGEEHFLMPVYGFLFLVQIKLQPSAGKLMCCVRYLGNNAFVSNFQFTLEIRNYHAVMKKTKAVTGRNKLVMNRCNSIEVSLKTIFDFMDKTENIYLVVDVHKHGSVCFKCKKDLIVKTDMGDGYKFHCSHCDKSDGFRNQNDEVQSFQLIKTD